MLDKYTPPVESVRFPGERATVAEIQKQHDFHGSDALQWGLDQGLVTPGEIAVAEVSPTLRCPEACPMCPDSSLLLAEQIRLGNVPRDEPRAGVDQMMDRVKQLADLDVKHFMFIGGTIDHLPELPQLVRTTSELPDTRVSWFTDMITQLNEKNGKPSVVLENNLRDGWIRPVATHVSMDYPYPDDPFGEEPQLPQKRGRSRMFIEDGEYSRRFKSAYGAVGVRRLIEAGVRRVVLNTTVGPKNLADVPNVYEQTGQLQDYARAIGSPTQVLWTQSPMIWRPHQVRGDSPVDSPASAGLQASDMPLANKVFSEILGDTYSRIAEGRTRLLANSSGYMHLLADEPFAQIVVDQDVPYPDGRPEIFQVTPTADIYLDPMFPGPELVAVRSIFGYRDRVFDREKNIFTQFQPDNLEWFPNIVST